MQNTKVELFQRTLNIPLLAKQCVTIVMVLIFTLGASSSFARYHMDREMVQAMVAEEARKQAVDPALALAVAHIESNFDPNALSHKGAIGVMQIMPATAWGEFGLRSSELYDPEINIRAGVSFLKQLDERYGRTDIVLSHYNGGSRVRGNDGRLQVIPVTRPYVQKVLQKVDYYQDKPQMLFASFSGDQAKPFTPDRAIGHEPKGRGYAAMKKRAEQLRKLRQKNLRLASALNTWVDPYLASYRNSPRARWATPGSKRAEVLQWESIYRD